MNTERARAMTVRGDMQLRAPAWAHQAGGGDGAVQIERGACEELAQAHVQSWLSKAGFLKLVGAGPAAHYRIGPSDRVVSDEIG